MDGLFGKNGGNSAMSIHGLRYFNDAGEVGYFNTPDDPYYVGGEQSRIGNSLFNTNKGISWCLSGAEGGDRVVTLTFERRCRALVDASGKYVVVIGEKKPEIAWPCNAAVFREDGSLDHQISLPDWVEHSFDGRTKKKYEPEGFYSLRADDGEVALSVYFCFEWFQIRIYDVQARTWGRVVGTGRA
jgi:hypothetical protein